MAHVLQPKAFGVKTGTRVRDAKRLCPGIVFLPSRHRLYVRYNLRIAEVLDRMAELDRIRSVDEFQLRLSGPTQKLSGAEDLVNRMKQVVAADVGTCLRFSAGIGPNQLLAKIAGKLEKPDGFKWLSPANMPDAIAHLAIDDLPGISKAMKHRLFRAHIYDTPALYALDPRHARLIWRSVEGERFVRALQGLDVPVLPTDGCDAMGALQPSSAYLLIVFQTATGRAKSKLHRPKILPFFCVSIASCGAKLGALRAIARLHRCQ